MILRRKRGLVGLAVFVVLLLLIRSKGFLITRAHPVVTQAEGWRIQRELSDYQVMIQDPFSIYYEEKNASAAELVLAAANSLGSEVLQYFEYNPADYIQVVLYSHEDELKGTLRIPRGQSAMGAYAGGMINLLSPDNIDLPEQDPDSLSNVFVHELAHLALDGRAKGNYPLWFTEGSALYMEFALLDYEWGKSLGSELYFSLDDLTYRFNSLNEQAAYRQSFLMVKRLIESGGRKKYLDFIQSLGNGANFHETLIDRYGIDIFS